jgi:bacteriorhodopsin
MDLAHFIVIGIIFGVVTSVIAQLKGHSGFKWFVLGFIAPLVALFIVILIKKAEAVPTPETHVKCPDCKELVLKEAKVCKHCRCKLIPSS